MSKSKRTKQREQMVFILSAILAAGMLALLMVDGQSTTRWLVFSVALMIAVTFGFLRRTH